MTLQWQNWKKRRLRQQLLTRPYWPRWDNQAMQFPGYVCVATRRWEESVLENRGGAGLAYGICAAGPTTRSLLSLALGSSRLEKSYELLGVYQRTHACPSPQLNVWKREVERLLYQQPGGWLRHRSPACTRHARETRPRSKVHIYTEKPIYT